MQLKQFLTDDRAVSPVIGVILMVAITVILAAVIGAFVLGLTDNVQSTPQAQFSFDQNSSHVKISHKGGDAIDAGNIDVAVAGSSNDLESSGNYAAGDSVTAGNSFAVGDASGTGDGAFVDTTLSSGDEIQVIYDNPDSDQTAILAETEYST